MKQNPNFLSDRVVFGLFSLLFILSAAQVSTLVSMDGSQVAQVVNLTNDKKCLQVTHQYNTDEFFHNGASSQYPGHFYRFRGFFNIKNICSFDISIVDTSTITQPGSLDLATIQGLSSSGNPVNLNFSDTTVFPASSPSLFSEQVDCPNCFDPSEQISFYASPVAVAPQGIGAMLLPAGQTRTFFVQTHVPVYDTGETVNQYQNFVRVMVGKFKWFRQASLSNGSIESNEIVTQAFSLSEKNAHVGDYVKFKHSPDYPEMTGSENLPTAIKR